MRLSELRTRIAQGEDSHTQFKRGPIGVSKLAAEMVAFSNAEGGAVLFGVDDDGTIAGLSKADAKLLDGEISNAANDNVRPSIYPLTEFHTIEGRLVLVVQIPEGISKPYSDKSGSFWIKSGPDKRRITAREELQRMLQKSMLVNADETPVPGTMLEDVDRNHFGAFVERNYGIDKRDVLEGGSTDAAQLLSNLGLLVDGRLTLAGLLLFGKDPQRYRRVDVVKCVRFAGTDMAGSTYFDSEDLQGNLFSLYKGIMAFLNRNLRHEQRGQGFNSIGIPEIPLEALEEFVVNMLLHRDYFVSSPWRVFVFDDRIELISPGSLPNHLSLEQMKRGVSVPRNPVLFSLAVKDGLPYRGIGSGVKRALSLVPNVLFENDSDEFFFKTIIPMSTSKQDIGGGKQDIQGVSKTTKQNMLRICEAFRDVDFFRRTQAMEVLPLSAPAMSSLLMKMKRLGIVSPVPGHGKGAYRVMRTFH